MNKYAEIYSYLNNHDNTMNRYKTDGGKITK